ncbi:hypothetical protein A2662_04520 [Candidatus Giovannonibacteria bacterium RIFCSPHIGHO2_01_FULL_45_33]|uniref:Fibronectin type-III domain-containing protein n=1 Tax=Candidatus Giovannonibacteria bacterium RIFCSPLOWO2_01_FULL_45_34 TaxID=1798351 RepID=A0A1F5WZT1_9BACT|nr:MAG: hypothetical protein A2662_04520 [Candidatus Giovannonibacteria bacterium RIFCSPHIGHO2_01_FULL_45_33]OGF69692.1 MAG: hypothetical protein A3C73_00130 [Candidatus Giovannonibacteria bacterium RIFCSPHIGHO2_02_FULL_44_11]OGF81144.1 MAG: hypothetical protein A2930_01075 [Candidatus Giovannonibacteria bacterium RIFCSPLOWO2_01_FULL_45_34]
MKQKTCLFVSAFVLIIILSFSAFAARAEEPNLDLIVQQLQLKIKDLQQQITTLQQQLESAKTAAARISEISKFTKTLQRGMTGDEVKELQEFLKQFPEIYPEGLVTGYFGSLTEAAVKRLQEQNGIETVGVVGPKTRAKLNELVSGGAGNSDVVPPGLLIAPGLQNIISTTTQATTTTATATTTPSGTIPATPAIPAIPSGGGGGSATPATPAIPATPTSSSDTTPPIISNIQATNITETSAAIIWTTDEAASSEVIYTISSPVAGTTTSKVSGANSATNHTVNLSNLIYSQIYYYVVVSKDAVGNAATSSEQSFTTISPITSPNSNPSNNRSIPSIAVIGQITGLNHPAGIAVNPLGKIYVADYHNDNIKVYDSDLNLIQTLGSARGSTPGQFSEPWDIAFDSLGNAYITDTNNRRVQVFSPEGIYLREFPSSAYQGISVNSDGLFYVSGRAIEVFNSAGQKIADLALGQNYYPRNIAIDASNRVYFSNWGNESVGPPSYQRVYDDNSSITIQTPQGELINKIALDYVPYFIDVDDKFRIWVADHTNGKIKVYDSKGVYITEFDLPFSACNICGSSFLNLNTGNPVGLEIHGNKLYASVMYDNLVRVYSISN